jgi:hypothetical protein
MRAGTVGVGIVGVESGFIAIEELKRLVPGIREGDLRSLISHALAYQGFHSTMMLPIHKVTLVYPFPPPLRAKKGLTGCSGKGICSRPSSRPDGESYSLVLYSLHALFTANKQTNGLL